MSDSLQRIVVRWMHVILSIPIIGYIYGDPAEVAQYAGAVRFIFLPFMLLSGLWMWKGHLLRRVLAKRPA
jgi:hypothetical protein